MDVSHLPPKPRRPSSRVSVTRRIITVVAGTVAFLALDVWAFGGHFGDIVFSMVTFCLPVDLVILFKPDWIDKYSRWYEERKTFYREGR
jgi:hypothetical protein